jgi:hypothetical protein
VDFRAIVAACLQFVAKAALAARSDRRKYRILKDSQNMRRRLRQFDLNQIV